MTLLLGAASVVSAQDAGFTRMPNGAEYKFFVKGAGEKVKPNDVMVFHFIQKTDKDSVLQSSYATGRPVIVPLQPSQDLRDLMYFFPLMAAKDSAQIRIPADSLFAANPGYRPPFLPAGSYLNFIIKMEKVSPMQEYIDKYKEHTDSLAKVEDATIDKYISDNKLQFQKTASGLRYRVTAPAQGLKPVRGDSVWVNYTGRTLAGKVFDSSIEADAKAAGLSQPGRKYEPINFVLGEGRVIPGWDEGIALLNTGAKASFLIPSALAYGERGAGEDIAPFSSLLFDVELVKVKAARKIVPASKLTPAKKGVSPKSTVRPAAAASKKAPLVKAPAKTSLQRK